MPDANAWKDVPPLQILEALLAAPSVAGPWYDTNFEGIFRRNRLWPLPSWVCAVSISRTNYTDDNPKKWWVTLSSSEWVLADTFEEAKAFADKKLQERGWVLIDEPPPADVTQRLKDFR